MSVALEGTVNTTDSPYVWKGTWQFLKEKKISLGFSYQRKDERVPRDLFDYVSFLNEAPMPVTYKKSKSHSSSKASRRSKQSVPVIPITGGDPLVESLGSNPEVATDAPVDDQLNTIPDVKDEPVNIEQPIGSTPSSGYITITHPHPLMGLWEGSFDVKSANGGEEPVAETLFFYSILGSELPLELSDLPPEPHFPYGLLRRETSSTPTKSPINPLAVATALTESSAINNNNNALLPEGTTAAVASSSSSAVPTKDVTESKLDNTIPTESDTTIPMVDPNALTTADANPLKLTPKKNVLPSYCANCVVLVGFGRNIFGRFSVAGLYDESTGELRCEKKYLVSKFAAKRGRKSYAETSSNAVYDDLDGAAGIEGMDTLDSIGRPQSTRHRYSSISYSDLLDDETTGLKRKRHSLGAAGAPYGSKLKFDINGGLIDVKKENVHHSSGGVNALIGSRNPDNDDPNAEYREAFQDCDTGEIYEGGWAYGMRYGRGVCLYADGLLYEGNWLQNREHGKGQLMTSDRQLIYSGDWLDGCFHGYGTYYFSNGDRYIGDWRESNRQGKGDYLFKNGCRYSGDWKDNKRHGKGVFVWPDESYYDGDWENDRRHGRGILELSNGFKYDGQWINNLMEGKGNCTFPSGQQYQGTYKNGLREGRGSVIFAEGAVYEGRFKEDRFDGQGTIKITENVPGFEDGELMIPIQIQSELWRIHLKAGFGQDVH